MYPWATKDYLLWNMTIGQIIYYHNIGIEIRNGTAPKSELLSKTGAELKAMSREIMASVESTKSVDEIKARYGIATDQKG